ncbi:MAG: hypothetical protein JJV97_06190 [SAR324 cluster bacterium]|nr:hypothetical protein [SAR324 cluster bacterium]
MGGSFNIGNPIDQILGGIGGIAGIGGPSSDIASQIKKDQGATKQKAKRAKELATFERERKARLLSLQSLYHTTPLGLPLGYFQAEKSYKDYLGAG